MRHLALRFTVFWLGLVLLRCNAATPPNPASSRKKPRPTSFYTADKYIRDAEDRAVLLHGINLTGQWKTSPFGMDATEGVFREIAMLGLNSIRLLTGWAAIMPEPGQIDQAYLNNLRQRVEWAAKYELLVVVDMHQDIFGLGVKLPNGWPVGNGAPEWVCSTMVEPITPWFLYYIEGGVPACFDRFYRETALLDAFAAAHRAVMRAVGELPNVLGFEILNEPFFGTDSPLSFETDTLEPFYRRVYARLTTDADNRILVYEPSVLKNGLAITMLSSLPGDSAIYAPHLYQQDMEVGIAYDGNPAFLDYRFDVDLREAAQLGAPLWLGEWGNAPPGPSAVTYITHFVDRADQHFVGWAYWDAAHLRRTDIAGRSSVALGLARPYVERAPNEPQFRYDTTTGRLGAEIEPDGQAETWIRFPFGWPAEILSANVPVTRRDGDAFGRLVVDPGTPKSPIRLSIRFRP